MSDKVEEEIEEILSKFSDFSGETKKSKNVQPEIIPFTNKPKISGYWQRLRTQQRIEKIPLISILELTPTKFFLLGAIITLAGFLLRPAWNGFLWISFSGILLFLVGFLWSLVQSRKNYKTTTFAKTKSEGGYWRGRYIEYGEDKQSFQAKIKKTFRK